MNISKELLKKNSQLYNEISFLKYRNAWIKYFQNLWGDRSNLKGQGWIDFESEISTMIQYIDRAYTIVERESEFEIKVAKIEGLLWYKINKILKHIVKDGQYINNSFKSYTNEITLTDMDYIKKHLHNDLNRLIRLLEIYLSDYISFENTTPLNIIKNLRIDSVLSFNYTDTYRKIYANNPESKIEYCFIHGQAKINHNINNFDLVDEEKRIKHNINNCDLVLGINEYLTDESKDLNNKFVEFKKFYQRIYKMTSSEYINWVEAKLRISKRSINIPKRIYIYGHSLDVTDRDVLRKLILAEEAKTIIFYHSKESLGTLIANLVKVIGEDELIKRTGGYTKTIEFRPTFKIQ